MFLVARQTKKLNMPQRTSRISNNSSTKITRQVVNLPSSSSHRGQTKAKSKINLNEIK